MVPLPLRLPPLRAPPRATPNKQISSGGALVYAIGDIHGRLDLLNELISLIARDARCQGKAPELIFIGDYVDRGPESNGVIDRLIGLKKLVRCRMLRGNHEAVLMDFLEHSEAGPTWASFGGSETMRSYGIIPPRTADPELWRQTRDAFDLALPLKHLHFLLATELFVEVGDYFFVHAGVRPKIPLAEQSEFDLLWIREPFLESTQPAEKIVVHGHTPTPEPYAGAWRIGIDTGAYATGALTAVRICDDNRLFIQTGGRGPSKAG